VFSRTTTRSIAGVTAGTWIGFCRTEIGVEVEGEADGGRRIDAAFLRRRIFVGGNRAEDDAVGFARLGKDLVGERGALGCKRGKADGALGELQIEIELAVQRFQDLKRSGRDFGPYAVAG
jgi:hypothetical protein